MQSETIEPMELAPETVIQVEHISVATRRLYRSKDSLGEKVPIFDQILQCLFVAVLAVGAYWLVSHKLLQSVQVEGRSMVPTLQPTEHYFLNRWIYSIRSPKPDEIVVLKDPEDSVLEVKRIIATAGESVYIRKGSVYVNGQLLKESYLSPGTKTYAAETADEFICCGRDQYYVLGDNRGVSRDSRYFGTVRRDEIIGKLIH